MSKITVYVDLDRTLFQTARAGEVWDYLAQCYPQAVDTIRERERRADFYCYDGDAYCHDMSAQLRSLGLTPEVIYAELAASPLADGRFEFDGCDRLIGYIKSIGQPVILTYGTDDYQRAKAALCPSLAGVPVVTTLRPKGEYLADIQPPVWMIDDKPIGAELPPHVRFVQVSLEAEPTVAGPWPVCASLDAVREYLVNNIDN